VCEVGGFFVGVAFPDLSDPYTGVMTFWGNVAALMPWADKNKMTGCMFSECDHTVGPGRGWRQDGMVFCSDEHAAAHQEDAAL